MKKEISQTADSVNEAKKEGYKYVVKFTDTSSLYACKDVNIKTLSEIYSDNEYEYNQHQQPKDDKHMGCPIDEAIECFKLN
jgi:hypothetical protein